MKILEGQSIMNQCQHGKLITMFCLNNSCNWPQPSGCQSCLRQYHGHAQKGDVLSVKELQEMNWSFFIKQEMKLKATRLQETVSNYFMTMKNQVMNSIDAIFRVVSGKVNYPYVYTQNHVNIFNKIKNRDFRTLTRNQIKNFYNLLHRENRNNNYIHGTEGQSYRNEVFSVRDMIRSIHQVFVGYGKSVEKFDNGFFVNRFYLNKIEEICEGIERCEGFNVQRGERVEKMEEGGSKRQGLLNADRCQERISFDNRSRMEYSGLEKNMSNKKKIQCESRRVSIEGKVGIAEGSYPKNDEQQQPTNDSQKRKLKMKKKLFGIMKNCQLPHTNQRKIDSSKGEEKERNGEDILLIQEIPITNPPNIGNLIKKKSVSLNNYEHLIRHKQMLVPVQEQQTQHENRIKISNSMKEEKDHKTGKLMELNKVLKENQEQINRFDIIEQAVCAGGSTEGGGIPHTMLPKPESKPKLYENTTEVKERKITIPIKKFEEEEENFSPILRKKREKWKRIEKGHQNGEGILKQIQQINLFGNKDGKSLNREVKCTYQREEKPLLKDNQAYSLALFMQSLPQPAQKAIPLLKAALKYAHNNLSAAEYLSYLHLEASKPKECLEVCNRILEQLEDNPGVNELSVHIMNNKAAALNMLGRASQSICILERCLKQTKQDIYYKTLGDAYFSIGMCDKAILSYENALKLNNLMEETYFNLGVCLYLQGQFYQAEFNVLEAIKINAENEEYRKLNQEIQKKIHA